MINWLIDYVGNLGYPSNMGVAILAGVILYAVALAPLFIKYYIWKFKCPVCGNRNSTIREMGLYNDVKICFSCHPEMKTVKDKNEGWY